MYHIINIQFVQHHHPSIYIISNHYRITLLSTTFEKEIMHLTCVLSTILLASRETGSAAFSPITVANNVGSSKAANRVNPIFPASGRTNSVPSTSALDVKPVTDSMKESYGEKSRSYRRTVYTHDDWVKHRYVSGRQY